MDNTGCLASSEPVNEDHAVPQFQQAQQIQDFTHEVFELTKEAWTAQSRSRGKMPAELTETEFLALDILASAKNPLTVGEIQRQIGILPAQMSRVVRSLESKGESPLIICSINTEDKRKINVQLTSAGQEALRLYREIKLGSIQKMLEDLNDHDRGEFVRIMRLIREKIRNTLEEKDL